MEWQEPDCSYFIRRIRATDGETPFVTGFEAFDRSYDSGPPGVLEDYWQKDQAGRAPTYLLLDRAANDQVVGVLRYRFEGGQPSASELSLGEGPYIYLSRIGVADGRQGVRLGSILLEFFYHRVLTEMRRSPGATRLVIWWKCVDQTLTVVSPLTSAGELQIFAQKSTDRWGHEYYIQQTVRLAP